VKKKAKAKKRRVRGKDWHAWTWKDTSGTYNIGRNPSDFVWWADYAPDKSNHPTDKGKWVRVKFVEVK